MAQFCLWQSCSEHSVAISREVLLQYGWKVLSSVPFTDDFIPSDYISYKIYSLRVSEPKLDAMQFLN